VKSSHPITFTDDVKLRFSSLLARIHKLAIGYEDSKKLVTNKMTKYFPDLERITILIVKHQILMAAGYHVEAIYLKKIV
jgi:hypothetical protein